MRSIPLVQRKHVDGPEKGDDKFHDQDLLVSIMRWVDPKIGVNFDEASKRIDLLDKIRSNRKRLDLEEDDWRTLCAKIKVFPAVMLDEEIHAACKAVIDAPQVKAAPAKTK